MLTNSQCKSCLKLDVCKEVANFKYAIHTISNANTTTEAECSVPVTENNLIRVSVECKMFYPKPAQRDGGVYDFSRAEV